MSNKSKHSWVISSKNTLLGRVGLFLRMLFFVTLFFLGVWAPSLVQTVLAGCYGSSCHGYNPNTMGCDSGATTVAYVDNYGGRVQWRHSSSCNSEWERTVNVSGDNRYVGGGIWWGCANYCYNFSTSSPNSIGNNQSVYTSMVGPASTIDSRQCGRVAINSVGVPVDYYCIGD